MIKPKLHSSQYIGMTETGDVAFDLSVFDRLYLGNIIITKRLTDKLIEKLIEHKDKVILHLTCTGMGGSKVEPFVPTVEQTYQKFCKLLEGGFPVNQVVLRIDPIVPTEKGMNTALKVIDIFFQNDHGIKRVRVSSMDMYPHVKERFEKAGFPIPYNSFHAPVSVRHEMVRVFERLGQEKGFIVEVCGEPDLPSTSCLSQKDIDILGLTDTIQLVGNAGQRGHCSCPGNKKQLIVGELHRCKNACEYCYLKGDAK